MSSCTSSTLYHFLDRKMLIPSKIAVAIFASQVIAATPYTPSLACNGDAIPKPSIFGAEILTLEAVEVLNFSVSVNQSFVNLAANITGLNFCNVSITHTHPGWNDSILTQVWLPSSTWSGRFQGTGGGGWVTGGFGATLPPAVEAGYAAASTDGGHDGLAAAPSNWALTSDGNVNLYLLDDFAATALSDMTLIGQAVTESFYGRPAAYSYWTGCSTGGRQGLMLAQRYPELYDGILAVAPAINWDSFIVAEYWAQHVMNQLDYYPPICELQAFTQAAITACDGLDGVMDTIIADPAACTFDPHSVVGTDFLCNGTVTQTFSAAGADVVEAAWTGPIDSRGRRQWYGLNKDASLLGFAATATTANGTTTGAPFSIATDWIKYFVARDPNYSVENMTDADYFSVLHQSRNCYASNIGTHDPDLSEFQASGGKMLTWHGLADQLIFPNGTVDYYKRVSQEVDNVQDFYRFFEAPGVAHCQGGPGPKPLHTLEDLVAWREQGRAPDVLQAANLTATGVLPSSGEQFMERDLCPWPTRQKYVGGNTSQPGSFRCV